MSLNGGRGPTSLAGMTNFSKRLCGPLAAALLALPALASAQRAAAVTDPTLNPAGRMNFAVLGALDIPTSEGLNVGPRIAGELMYGLGELSPKLHLDVGPRLAWTYNGGDGGSLWTIDALATARLTYLVAPKLSLYGQAGLGLGYYHVSIDDVPFGFDDSDSGVMFDILFAPGVIYAISPSMNLIGEVGIWINAKSGVGTHIAIPTIGLQWKI